MLGRFEAPDEIARLFDVLQGSHRLSGGRRVLWSIDREGTPHTLALERAGLWPASA